MDRTARNAIKIENKSGRVSQVPIDPTETIYQGDMVMWAAGSPTGGLATKMTAAGDGVNFIGVSDHTNPQATAGSLTSDITKAYINVVQSGLVEMIAGASEHLDGFDTVEMVTDAQHVQKTATQNNVVGIIDPGWAGAAGKDVVIGDAVKLWLKVSEDYQVWMGRQT